MARPAFKRVEELFHQAVALETGQRRAFLDAACAGDPDLRAAVENLLRHDSASADTDSFPLEAFEIVTRHRQGPPTSPAPALDGSTEPGVVPGIPGYEILAELGRGGMGVVYKALQTSLNRLVALKMLLPAGPISPDQLARFRTEAEALARLNHPNIVPIYEVGEWADRPYFTMEYVQGPSLAEVLDGRPQDVAGSARLIETLARAVEAVHQHGVIHRDLKPANILLAGEPATPKITDFGLAKDLTAGRRLTQSGTALGTPCYMAPEQVRSAGVQIGPAADVYALGSILYELLTGRTPFDAETGAETLHRLLHDEPLSPRQLRPRLPRDLSTICLKCLEKSPGQRYASAADLAEDLHRFLAGLPIKARPVGVVGRAWRWCRRRPLVAALLGLSGGLAVALVVTVLSYNARLQDALARVEAKAGRQERQIIELNITIGLAGLESGDTFTAVLRFTEALRLDEGNPEQERRHRMRIAAALRNCPRLLELHAPGKPVLCTRLVKGGGWLATAELVSPQAGAPADNRIEVWDARTGEPVAPALQLPDRPIAAALGPDGQSLALVSAEGTTRVWSLKTRTFRGLPVPDGRVRRIAFHPDGRTLFTQHADATIRLWDLTLSQPAPLQQLPGSDVVCTSLSDDGSRLFTLADHHIGQVWDTATGKAVAAPLKLGQPATLAALSGDGQRVALLGTDGALRVWDTAAEGWIGVPFRPRPGVSRLALSQDGSRVVTANAAGEAWVWEVKTGQVATPLLRHCGPLASVGFGAGDQQVVVVGQEGTVRVWELPGAPGRNGHPRREMTEEEGVTPDPRPVADLLALARVLSCCRIENQQQQLLTPDELHSTWRLLQRPR